MCRIFSNYAKTWRVPNDCYSRRIKARLSNTCTRTTEYIYLNVFSQYMYLDVLVHVVTDWRHIYCDSDFSMSHSIMYSGVLRIQNTSEYVYMYSEYEYVYSILDNLGFKHPMFLSDTLNIYILRGEKYAFTIEQCNSPEIYEWNDFLYRKHSERETAQQDS